MSLTVLTYTKEFDAVVDYLKKDITGLRTGRASSALVEDIMVEAYGTKQPLKSVASISIADAKTLVIETWDKTLLAAVENAIRVSPLALNPVNDGKALRIFLPELSEERRIELIKLLYQKIEHARISVRKVREAARDDIEKAFKAKEMGEDEKYTLQTDLEELVKKYNNIIKTIGEEKEIEIQKI